MRKEIQSEPNAGTNDKRLRMIKVHDGDEGIGMDARWKRRKRTRDLSTMFLLLDWSGRGKSVSGVCKD